MTRWLRLWPAVGCATLGVACGGTTSTGPMVAAVDLSGCETPIEPRQSCLVIAIARASTGEAVPGAAVTWRSSNEAILTVAADGVVTGVSDGAASVSAAADGTAGSKGILVRTKVTMVELSGCDTAILPDQSCTLSATITSASGETLLGRTVFWISDRPVIASVNQGGVVTGHADGATQITAQAEGVSSRRPVSVHVPTAVVELVGCEATIQSEESCELSAAPKGADGIELLGRTIDWTSTKHGVATVDQSGKVTGVAQGETTILAAVEGILDSVRVRVGGFASISAGSFHACGIKSDSTAYCWGWNSRGQLGDSSNTQRTTPVPVRVQPQFGFMTGREFHSCGLVWRTPACWGSNDHGELGLGNLSSANFPMVLPGTPQMISIATGEFHSCGVLVSGAALCWGYNLSGQLGIGGSLGQLSPTAVVGGHQFQSVVAGSWFTCGLGTNGAAWCWGSGSSGQLGNGTPWSLGSPTAVADGHLFVALTAGATHACGLKASGEVWCWGSGGGPSGVGDGTTLVRFTPVPVFGGHSFTTIASSGNHTCGITTAGKAWCWGRNDFGQLGNYSQAAQHIPVPVNGGHTFISITTGAYFTCALKATGATWCWGHGGRGQLGDGIIRDWSLVPTRVIAP